MKTKLVEVNLSALTRVEYSVYVEVPEDFDIDEQGDELASLTYNETSADDFHDDFDYWEKGECYTNPYEDHESGETPTYRLVNGKVERI